MTSQNLMTSLQRIRAIMTSRPPRLLALFALGLIPGSAWAQSSSFQLRVTQGTNVFLIPNGSTLTMAPSAVGQVSTATLTVLYVGSTAAVITSQPEILGSVNFTVTSLASVPLTMLPGDSFTVTLNFKPNSSASALAQLNIPFVEEQISTTGLPSGVPGLIQLNLTGTAPSLVVSYALQSNGNVLPLANGSSAIFPATLVGQTTAATVLIANQGSGAGTVNSITVSGAAFKPVGLPLVPFSVAAGTDITFVIDYTPTAVQTDTGTLQIDLGGNSFSAGLTGTGINFQYSYQMITSTGSSSFSPDQAVSLPDTQVGNTTSVTVKVQNTGTAVGTIAAIATTNGPFTLANLPILPKTLNPNDIAMFTLSFTPTQTGKNTATLQIGNDLFTLTGNGLGPKLDFSYGSALPTVVQNGGAVIFSPVQVGQTATLPFTVTNDGTTPGQLASIAVTDTKGIFTVSNLPSLPITLKPGDTFTFNVSFTPALTGITTSILEIDTQTFNLSGSGTAPPALPAVQFTGASGAVNAFSQPAIGLSLASPYPLAVSGTLTISISSQFNPDPTVQFGTGGKTVQFTIPANSTEAVFARGSNQALLQSGTTASMITISAALATASGLDLTPSPAPSVLLTVSSAAPTLLSVILTSESSTSFALQITGFSTTHSLTNLNFQFTTTGVNIPTGGVSVDVSAAASNWYASTTSQPFAGQFLISMPFILTQGSSSSTTSLVSEIQSATVTASNAQGASNTLSIPIAGP